MSRACMLVLVCLVPLVGCVAQAEPAHRFNATSSCNAWGERPCLAAERECRREAEWRGQDCWSICVSIGDCTACPRLSSTAHCNRCEYDRTPAPCAERQFSFTRAPEADVDLEAACLRMVDARATCSTPLLPDARERCAVYARVERPEMIANYDCVAAAGCDEVATAACSEPEPRHDLAGAACAAIADRCEGDCSEALRDALDHVDGWLRDDVAEAVDLCLEADSCDDYVSCLQQWYATITEP